MNFLKTNFFNIIIFILIIILLIGRCNDKISVQQPTIVRDTIWKEHAAVINTHPQLTSSVPFPVDGLTKEIQYLPDTNYQKLLIQYQELVALFLAKNIQKDKLKIDSIGYVSILDTVSKNLIIGRKFTYDLKYPIIKTTITLPAPKINQLYVGVGIQGSSTSLVNQFDVGVMLKNRKDQLYGISLGVDKNLTPIIGISSYWKINFRKK
jgi:hypothetical protein